jgi:hypothetical protein
MLPHHTYLAFRFPLLALLGSLLLSVSCIRVEQTLTLQADGSGTFDLRYGMSEEDAAEMKRMAGQAAEAEGLAAGEAPQSPFDFDEESVRKDFEEYRSSGVTLEKVKSETVDGWKYINLTVRFASLKSLAETEFVSDRGLSLTRRPDGHYEFRQAAPPQETEPDVGAVGDMMNEVMKGFHATVRVVVPSRIVESNADRAEDRAVTWEFDLARDARALERARKMDLRVVFDGQGIDLPDFRSEAE